MQVIGCLSAGGQKHQAWSATETASIPNETTRCDMKTDSKT